MLNAEFGRFWRRGLEALSLQTSVDRLINPVTVLTEYLRGSPLHSSHTIRQLVAPCIGDRAGPVTMVAFRETQIYRQDARANGNFLTPEQREDLLKSFLPAPPQPAATPQRQMSRPIRNFLKSQLHILVFTIVHILFSIYIRIRQTYHIVIDRIFAVLYYHHRAPELIKRDVKDLSRIPQHLSVILDLKGNEGGTTGLESLMDEVAEISAWCICAGIPMLSVYERTGSFPDHAVIIWKPNYSWLPGILKAYIPKTHRVVSSKLHAYFGRTLPYVQVGAPHIPAFFNNSVPPEVNGEESRKGLSTPDP